MKTPTNEQNALIELVSELEDDCNRYANGVCHTVSCLSRGGYKRGEKPDYEIATCERHEQVKALKALMAK